MKRHESEGAIQTEIRKLENRYAILFSRSDLKGLISIKRKLDELKLELRKQQSSDGQLEQPVSGTFSNFRPAAKKFNISRKSSFKVRTIVNSTSIDPESQGYPDTLPSFLQFRCVVCNSDLNFVQVDADKCECQQGHSFTRSELVDLFSEKIYQAMQACTNQMGGSRGNNDRFQSIGQRIDILQNILGIINKNLTIGT